MLGRHSRAVVIGLIVFALTAPTGFLYWGYARHFESSDDAFIAARQFPIAPKVSGYITAVPVTDNQHIASCDVIARIDERDYRIALEQAQAQVANAKANIQNIDAQTSVQQAQIASNQAQVEQAKAALVFAQQQANRYTDLAKKGWDPVQTEQQYASQLRQQQAALDSAEANLKLAQRQIESLKAQRDSAVANLQQAQAQRDQAQLNLSYTTISAAQAGRVVNLTAAAGQFAQPGTNLSIFVPDEIWVVANFKETQLDAMRPGQPVTVRIDAYPERIFRGHVASVQPGSGTAFSLLPAENATGNYVKIVQRVCQCGTAVHRGQHGGERRRGVLGNHHLSGSERCHPDCQQLSRPVVGSQDFFPDFAGAVHDEFGPVRICLESAVAADVPHPAGPRWRRHGPGLAVDPGKCLSA